MRKLYSFLKFIVAFTVTLVSQTIIAQDVQETQKALSLVQSNATAIGLSQQEIADSRISDTYVDALSGNTLVYLQQTYQGIDVDKIIQVLAFKNGKLVSGSGKRFEVNILKLPVGGRQKRVATSSISPESAIQAAAQHLHLSMPSLSQRPAVTNQDFSKSTDFGDLGVAKKSITARQLWVPQKSFERIKLVWEVNLSPKKSTDNWRVIVDATTGSVIKKENYTKYDNWDKIKKEDGTLGQPYNDTTLKKKSDHKNDDKNDHRNDDKDHHGNNDNDDRASVSYRVVPFPLEAPGFQKHSIELVSDPWKLSPTGSGATTFIWNSDGSKRYKFTRGNNVLAQEDVDGDDVGKPLMGVKKKKNRNDLFFDYAPDFTKQPTDSINQGFAITNLFYWNNIMHDLSYQYGFDEVSGNFQQNNLHRGGEDSDFVIANAQYAADAVFFNNSYFFAPPDGGNSYMYMLLWDVGSTAMKINSPASIAGNVAARAGHFGPKSNLINTGPVTGDVVLYNNASDTFHSACDVAGNADKLKGKIALFTLIGGSCEFYVTQVLNAQHAGAIAVIMMNELPGQPLFGWTAPPGYEDSVKVPAVLISYEDGIKMRTVLSAGSSVNITLFPLIDKDADLDNGVIAHEYTHGISQRLTGGPSTVSCLSNLEQMGEGWSDYISLVTITDWHKAHKDDGALPRTIGTYVLNQPTNGAGIRQFPYSTDMTINPHTYADIATAVEEHAVGEIWASVLWDMTWNIIEQEGINKDIFNANGGGGNSVAYKLVIEGLKLQPCSPGFIDGRDAILKADTLLYDGKHSCAIWNAFARRGMGLGASQGNSDKLGDEKVDFTMGAVYITKHADKKSAAPGGNINYTIGLKAKSVCGGRVEQNYSVTDSLPGNVTYVSSDGMYNPANRTVSFNNINMNDGDSLTLKLKVKVKTNASFADTVYIDDSVNAPIISDKWVAHNGKNLAWTILDVGILTYYTNDTSGRDEENLATVQAYLIPGINTTFSFFHNFETDDINNGGVIEISTNEGITWQDLGPYMDPAGLVYTTTITGNSVLTGRKAFSGFGNGGKTTIDLSPFAGKKVKIRFRYATSDNSFAVPNGETGWILYNIVFSASPIATNTAKLFNQAYELKGSSTVMTKIEGKNIPSADFVVVKRDAQALLSWHTPAEINDGTFQVERSTDNGTSFKAIAILNTVNENADLHPYNFTDAGPSDGLNLYRISHTGSNGAVSYSDVRSVLFDNLKGIRVFPNPAKDKIKVYIPGNDKPVTLRLMNVIGNQVKTYRMAGQNIELNLPVLSPGTYYLDIRRNSSTSRHTIVIE
ncbi:MAG: M36 family metallopeptidase [Ginsengibacter sp.]